MPTPRSVMAFTTATTLAGAVASCSTGRTCSDVYCPKSFDVLIVQHELSRTAPGAYELVVDEKLRYSAVVTADGDCVGQSATCNGKRQLRFSLLDAFPSDPPPDLFMQVFSGEQILGTQRVTPDYHFNECGGPGCGWFFEARVVLLVDEPPG